MYLYESLILEQKLNYFILESRYNEMILNESVGDKLKSVKKWIVERFKDLIKLFTTLKDRISKFFKEVVLKKIKQIKEKIFKNKSKKDDKLETINIAMLLRDLDKVDIYYINFWIEKEISLGRSFENCTDEYMDEVIDKIKNSELPKIDDIKKELKLHSIDEIENTKIEITKKEIEDTFKLFESKLKKVNLEEIDKYIIDLKKSFSQFEKNISDSQTEERMALLIKYHNVQIQYETKRCAILNSIAKLNNQYISKALSYFDTYLKNDKKSSDKDMESLSDDFKDSMTYAGKDLKKAIDNKNYVWIRGTMMNAMWNDPTFEHGEFDKLISICKKYIPKVFEQEKTIPSEEHFDQSKWTKDYFTDLTYYFRENPALSRISYIKKVGKYVYSKNNNQKKNDN